MQHSLKYSYYVGAETRTCKSLFVMFKSGKTRCMEGAFARFIENMLYSVIFSLPLVSQKQHTSLLK